MAKLKDCDLVIEAVVENLEIKHKLFAEVEKEPEAGCGDSKQTRAVFRSNQLPSRFRTISREHFIGVHFFNPPRYMKLVEIIPAMDGGEIACKICGCSINGLARALFRPRTGRTLLQTALAFSG